MVGYFKHTSRQGLKSSSAVCVAAIKACEATGVQIENSQIVDFSAANKSLLGFHLLEVMTILGLPEPGWKLVDINAEDAQSGLLLESPGPSADDWKVILVCRGDREKRPQLEDFTFHQQAFVQALNALQEGNDLVALTWNGRAVVGALNDPKGRKLTNDAFVNGARAAGISGSGPAIAIFVPAVSAQSIERIKRWYSKFDDVELIET